MNLQKHLLMIETKAKLSTLWMFYLFNVIFRDIHEFVEPGFIEQIMTGTFNLTVRSFLTKLEKLELFAIGLRE